MASKHLMQHQNRGEVVAPAANKAKNIAGGVERKNRRALGDIGNVVTIRGPDGKPLPQVSRPVTRSFCAQLLANAQQVAGAEKKKNLLPVNANGGAVLDEEKKIAARKPAQKKVVVKPKQEVKTEISPDIEEAVVKKEEAVVKKENVVEKSSKKKAPTLTSTLTARSKAACGLSDKPKLQIVDIDASDANNHLAVVEYIEEIYQYYKLAENEGRAHDYMDSQPELNDKMRAILIDWLVQVHYKFELNPETLYLTINIVDRYLASKTTSRRELQLVGLSAMLIASKYEEIWAPEVNELVSIADNTYSNKQILVMEKQILGQLEWNLTVPTLYVFLVRFVKASMTDLDVESMAFFLAELGMMNYKSTIMYSPSMIAASAVYAARCTFNEAPMWNDTLRLHTGFSESDVMGCAALLVRYHSMAAENNLRGIYKKYSSSERSGVALLPPAKALLPAA